SVVLLERGTKLVGETRGEVQQGAARLFVLWTEARTPTGVVVPLSSPGTDELGRSGLPGEVNRHFWDRFGAAILLTVLNGAVQGAVNSQNSGGSVVVSPATSTDIMTEVCINRPGEAFVETRTGWERRPLPFADFDWCARLAKLIANSTRQRIDEATPLLSASLPTGERAQIVLPPATTPGTVAITLRRPSQEVWSITELARRGIFRATRRSGVALDETEQALLTLLASQEYEAFMRLAVVSRKNILVSGPTGSGKTTWTKALIREIPGTERLI